MIKNHVTLFQWFITFWKGYFMLKYYFYRINFNSTNDFKLVGKYVGMSKIIDILSVIFICWWFFSNNQSMLSVTRPLTEKLNFGRSQQQIQADLNWDEDLEKSCFPLQSNYRDGDINSINSRSTYHVVIATLALSGR